MRSETGLPRVDPGGPVGAREGPESEGATERGWEGLQRRKGAQPQSWTRLGAQAELDSRSRSRGFRVGKEGGGRRGVEKGQVQPPRGGGRL